MCLTLVTNAAVLWTTTYLDDAFDALRADGYPVTNEVAAHRTPAQHDHINFGTYFFDVETELRRRDTVRSGYRLPEQARQAEGTRFVPLLREPPDTRLYRAERLREVGAALIVT